MTPLKQRPFVITICTILAVLATAGVGFKTSQSGQVKRPTVRIAHFRNDLAAAYSFTMDDGSANQVRKAVPILDKYGFKATFFVIAGPTPDYPGQMPRDSRGRLLPDDWAEVSWPEWRELADRGYEIGNHTLNHRALSLLDDATVQKEVQECERVIERKVGRHPLSFAFPFSARTSELVRKFSREFVSVRGDSLVFLSAGHLARYNRFVDGLIRDRKAGISMLHGLEGVGWEPIKADVFRKHVDYVASRRDQVWVETEGNVALYSQERDRAEVEIDNVDPNSVTFHVTCPLDPAVYNYPLTAVIAPPTRQVAHARVQQADGDEAACASTSSGILVDVAPSGKPVTVVWDAEE